jgi:hypothetical protein
MFSSSVLARGRAHLQGNDTEQKLASLLHDDAVQMISSFELNQIASLSYGPSVCDQIFEILLSIVAHPVSYSPLTLQKTLVMTKHLLIYGAEGVVNCANCLNRHVQNLQNNYNTVLLAQQQQGAAGMLFRLQGGGVDKGGPVRAAAAELSLLLNNHNQLRHERAVNADPNSLVPIGDVNQIAFCSDEVRHMALQKRIQKQAQDMEIKSNLAKADNGFGSGYNAADGKMVVGAAHSLEEMMQQAERVANREKQKFSDDGTGRGYTAPKPALSFALKQQQQQQQQQQQYGQQQQQYGQQQQQQSDLLGMDNPSSYSTSAAAVPEADLLDFSSGPVSDNNINNNGSGSSDIGDLLGGGTTGDYWGGAGETTASGAADVDLFGDSSTMTTAAATDTTADLFGSMSIAASSPQQPSAAATAAKKPIMGGGGGGTASGMNMNMTSTPNSHDRFSALDALGGGGSGSGAGGTGSKTLSLHSMNTSQQPNSLSDLGGWSMTPAQTTNANTNSAATATAMPSYSSESSWKVSASMVPPASRNTNNNDDDADNGFAMGGSAGAGLEPLAAAPAAPPPPPPPAAGLWSF